MKVFKIEDGAVLEGVRVTFPSGKTIVLLDRHREVVILTHNLSSWWPSVFHATTAEISRLQEVHEEEKRTLSNRHAGEIEKLKRIADSHSPKS